MARVDVTVRRAVLALGVILLLSNEVAAESRMRRCRQACTDEITACTAGGRPRFACRKLVLGQCKRSGGVFCGTPESGIDAPPTLTAAVAGSGTVDLRWVDVANRERNWIVERALSPTGEFAVIAVTGRDVTAYRDGGLASGLTLYYRVWAMGRGERARSAYSNVASVITRDMTPPSLPSGLRVAAVRCGQIDLAWGTSSDIGGAGLKGYNVYRNGSFLKLVTATTTTDGGLAASTAYGYAVSAIDHAGNESARSAVVSVTPPACPDATAPTVPAGLAVSASGCTGASLGWSASTDGGGAGLKGYNVYRNGSFLKLVTATTTTDGGLAASTAYGYAVSAIDHAGNESARSAVVSVTPPACPDATAPTVPAGLAVSASGCTGASLGWSASTDGGGAGLKGYNVYRNGSFLKLVTATTTTDGGLAASTAYGYAVSAIDHAGNESARSAVVSVTPPACPDATAPTVPAGLAVSASGCTGASLGWSASTDGGGAGLKGYNVYRNGSFLKLVTATTTTDGGLAASTAYGYAVSAIDHAGNESARSAVVSVTPPACPDATAPTVPAGLAVSASGCTGASLGWSASTDGGGAGLKGYNVYRNGSFLKLVTTTTTTDGGLAASTAYGYAVSAIDHAGNESARSAVVSVTPPACPDATAPTVPAGLAVSASGCTGASLGWSASTDGGGAGLKGYNVYRNGSFLKLVTATTTTDGGLAASTAYGYAVSAIDHAGNESARSAVVSVTPPACPDTAAPTTPAGVSAAAGTCSQTSVTWAASTDTGGSGLKGYNVFRNGTFLKQVAGTTTTDGGLSASTVYGYAVSAIDNAGNESPRSATASTNTPACPDATPPTTPANVSPAATSCTQVNVTWAASTDSGGAGLKGYKVYRAGTFLKEVAGTSTTDTGLTASTSYAYSIAAIDNAGNESARSPSISTTTPACPSVVSDARLAGCVAAIGAARDVVVENGLAYVASGEFGLAIADVANPASPTPIGVANPPFYAERVAVSGTLAVLTGNGLGLNVVDVSDPRQPRVLSSLAGRMKGVALSGQSAYVLLTVPGNPAHEDLLVLDLRAPTTPVIAGRLTIGTATELRVVGSIAILGGGSAGVRLVDVGNPAAPRIIATVDTPGSAGMVAVSGRHVFVADGSAVLAVDLDATPPAIVGSLATTASKLAVAGTRLYVLDGLQLKVVDVTNPAAPALLGTSNAYAAHGVDASGSFVFLASPDVDTAANKGGLYVIDASVPTAPRMLANVVGGHDNWGVGVAGNLGVVAGNAVGLKVVDLGDPERPRAIGTLAGVVKDATMAGQYAYVILIVPGNPARIDLAVVDLVIPSRPVIVGRVTVPGGTSVEVDGSFAYVGAGPSGLQIVDVSVPTTPRIVGVLDTPGSAQEVDVAGNYAYVADGTATLVVNVSDRTRPALTATVTTPSTALTVAASRLYVIGGLSLKVIDVANAATPLLRGSTSSYGGQAVQVIGNSAFLATPAINHFDASGGLYMLNVADPAAPRLVKQIIVPGTTRSLVATNGRVYAGDSAGILDVVELLP